MIFSPGRINRNSAPILSGLYEPGPDAVLKGLPIDRWVSGGHSKLMRLPFSLHGVVSRVVLQLTENEMESFDPGSDERVMPGFLK